MFSFPFSQKRKFQDDIVREIFEALTSGENMLVSAPTGIGKTAGVLYPALCYAFENFKRVFFITPKTTQQQIVIDTLKKMQVDHTDFRAIIVKAKEKICPNAIFYCHPDFCTYIRDCHSKIKRSRVVDNLLSHTVLDPDIIYAAGIKEGICPFELSLEMLTHATLIVCDYNYVFAPHIHLRGIFSSLICEDGILIIDEAHNLYHRGMDYYSPQIQRGKIARLLHDLKKAEGTVCDRLRDTLLSLDGEFLKLSGFQGEKSVVKIDKEFFKQKMIECEEGLKEYLSYLKAEGANIVNDPVRDFIAEFEQFVDVLFMEGEEFSYIYDKGHPNHSLKILCMDPSVMLGTGIGKFYSAIAMSATLEPLLFYQDVLGFRKENTRTISYPSPFPLENRKILVIPEVSTKYRERKNNYQKIADIIKEIIIVKEGHYFAFFPSFAFLRQVEELIDIPSYEILSQEERMGEAKRELFLAALKENEKNLLVLAVQGGIFAEGVDYPGDMLIGAMVIGPGLPAYCFEQELIKGYFKKKYNMGFEYSYLYPGLSRVIQSVGRVIRSDKDVGVIALIDRRFKNPYYNSIFPSYWYDKNPEELVSKDYKRDITEFWRGAGL